jgi:hypothetical protein
MPAGPAAFQIGAGAQLAVFGIDHHAVALAQQRDRAAPCRFRRDVADHEAMGGAGETAVGDQRHVVAEAAADQRRGDAEHLAHAGAAGGPFVADHDDVAGVDAIALHGGERFLLALEDARAAFEVAALAGQFENATLRCEVAVKDRVAAARFQRLADWMHHVLCFRAGRRGRFGE